MTLLNYHYSTILSFEKPLYRRKIIERKLGLLTGFANFFIRSNDFRRNGVRRNGIRCRDDSA